MTKQNQPFRRRDVLKTIGTATIGVAVYTGSASAQADIEVPGDYGTIQAAVNAATDGDTIEVDSSGGTYNESVTIDGTDNLTLTGIGNPTVVGDGNSTGSQPHATIHVDGNGPTQGTTIKGFTIRNPDGHYGVFAGTGGSNSDVDGFELRANVIEDIGTNLSSHNPLTGAVAGLYVRAQYNNLTVENNTVENVDTTGEQYRNAVGLSFSSFTGDAAFDSSDSTSEAANNTTVSNNSISGITGAESGRTKGISVSGEFDDLTIGDNTITGISAPTNDSTVLGITLTENPPVSGVDPDNDGTEERIGPKNFVIERNDIDNLTGGTDSVAALFIGGYEDLGDGHDVHLNNFLSGAVSRVFYDQNGFDESDADTLSAECNYWGHATGPENEDNPQGKGQPVVGEVDYRPWSVREIGQGENPEKSCVGGKNDDRGKGRGN